MDTRVAYLHTPVPAVPRGQVSNLDRPARRSARRDRLEAGTAEIGKAAGAAPAAEAGITNRTRLR